MANIQATIDKEGRAFWKKMQKDIVPILNEQWDDAAHYVENGNINGIDHAVREHQPKMAKTLNSNYKYIAYHYQDYGRKLLGQKDIKTIGGSYWQAVNKHIQKQTAEKVVMIGNTTKNSIKRIIKKGLEDQLSGADLAKRIRDVGNIINKSRATNIARTESHSIQIYSIDESVKSTGVEFIREWSSTLDERTRIDHSKADGQLVDMEEPFEVGGEALMYPGDPKGSPENICRCRCVVLYRKGKTLNMQEEGTIQVPDEIPENQSREQSLEKIKAYVREKLPEDLLEVASDDDLTKINIGLNKSIGKYLPITRPGLKINAIVAENLKKGTAANYGTMNITVDFKQFGKSKKTQSNINMLISDKKAKAIEKLKQEIANYSKFPVATDDPWLKNAKIALSQMEVNEVSVVGSKIGLDGVIAHEGFHHVGTALVRVKATARNPITITANTVFKKELEQLGILENNMGTNKKLLSVSKYATTSFHEAFAETGTAIAYDIPIDSDVKKAWLKAVGRIK